MGNNPNHRPPTGETKQCDHEAPDQLGADDQTAIAHYTTHLQQQPQGRAAIKRVEPSSGNWLSQDKPSYRR